MSKVHIYSDEQINKIGNTIRFFTKDQSVSKTKLLKLLYLAEEVSIKKYAVPLLNISFQVWKFGPVAEPIFIETSSNPSMFKSFFEILNTKNGSEIIAKGQFEDFEFSDNDIEVLEFVKCKYSNASASELIAITHRINSPWYKTAYEKGVLQDLLEERITNTHFSIDLTDLIDKSNKLKMEMYAEFLEIHGNPNKIENLV
jgi:uncharacterized phage-associated protein